MQLLFRSQEELPYDLAMTDKIFNFLPLPIQNLKTEALALLAVTGVVLRIGIHLTKEILGKVS